MQVSTAEAGARLREGRLQGAEIADAGGSAGGFKNDPVKCDDFPERQKTD